MHVLVLLLKYQPFISEKNSKLKLKIKLFIIYYHF